MGERPVRGRDEDGFPMCAAEWFGDLFTDENGVTWVCDEVPGAAEEGLPPYAWRTFDSPWPR